MKRLLLLLFALVLLTSCAPPEQNVSAMPPSVSQATVQVSPPPPPDMSFADSIGEVECRVNGVAIELCAANIMSTTGVPYTTNAVSRTDIAVESAVDFAPVFNVEPQSVNVSFYDREGAPIADVTAGTYLFDVVVEFERDDWSGTLTFGGDITVLGAPEIIMSTDSVLQGEVITVIIDGAADYHDYQLYLPHLEMTVDCIPIGEADGGAMSYAAFAQINVVCVPGSYTMELRKVVEGVASDAIATAQYNVTADDFIRQDLQTSGETQSLYTNENLNSDNEKSRAARESSNRLAYFDGKFIYPLPSEAKLTTQFGQERYVNGNFQSRHSGLDLALPLGTDIYATARGRVTLAEELIVNGNTVIIDHGMGVHSAYSHMDSINVEVGDMVEQGAVIGQVGSTGYSTGPHLHFTVTVGSYYVNPMFPIDNDLLGIVKEWKGLIE